MRPDRGKLRARPVRRRHAVRRGPDRVQAGRAGGGIQRADAGRIAHDRCERRPSHDRSRRRRVHPGTPASDDRAGRARSSVAPMRSPIPRWESSCSTSSSAMALIRIRRAIWPASLPDAITARRSWLPSPAPIGDPQPRSAQVRQADRRRRHRRGVQRGRGNDGDRGDWGMSDDPRHRQRRRRGAPCEPATSDRGPRSDDASSRSCDRAFWRENFADTARMQRSQPSSSAAFISAARTCSSVSASRRSAMARLR